LILSLIYSRQLSKPIIEMNNEADKLAKGDFDVHFEQDSGSRELDELGEKLNYAASELSKVNALRTELIANVSHDLRTPLTLITGYSEMMRDLPGENNTENLNLIIEESKRLSQIVTDVLDISKYQSGSVQLEKTVFCLTDEVISIKERLSAFTSSNGYSFSFDYDDRIYVNADRGAISRVIYNLVSNAINYTDSENRSIEIVQTVTGSTVKIDVIDHGKGIAQEDLPYVFDRYYRSGDAHVRAVLGSGLGLSIVKTILTAHDAKFGVISSPGRGSDFWFSLDTVDKP
ncbi:MAG: HAMP domain-containing histidine kinase, partial [Oscillospiraceae bacterium]|nr:HAMP domain-containing histidine kinase [Oscillospiraceae bacterium]